MEMQIIGTYFICDELAKQSGIREDPFGHKVISVEGPALEYKISHAFQCSPIIGYKPATITLHSQMVSKLSPAELDEFMFIGSTNANFSFTLSSLAA